MPGIMPRTTSSMLGFVAPVIAIVSPSQLRPAVSHKISILEIGEGIGSGDPRQLFKFRIMNAPGDCCRIEATNHPAGQSKDRLSRVLDHKLAGPAELSVMQ